MKQWKQAVVFQVGTGNLDLPRTPTVFDVSDELAKHQVWSIQLHKAYATAELWKSCEAQKTIGEFAGKGKGKKNNKNANIAETLKTLVLSKLQGKSKLLLDEVDAWAGRVVGADDHMYLDALLRVPTPLQEALRRSSGVDGIFFEAKLQGDARKEERKLRPVIPLPADWTEKQRSAALKRDGSEGLELWGRKLMIRVSSAKEAELRLAFTGREQPPYRPVVGR